MRIFTLLLLLCVSLRAADGPVTTLAKSNTVNSVNTAVIPVTNIDIQIVFDGFTNRIVAGSNVTIAVTSSNITINASSGGGSQTPLLSNVDGALNSITNLQEVDAAVLNGTTVDFGTLESSDTAFTLFDDGSNGNIQDSAGILMASGSITFIQSDPLNSLLYIQPGGEWRLLYGTTSPDATGAAVQFNGDLSTLQYWCQGQEGGNGFSVLDADGVTTHTVYGGMVAN